MEHWDEIGFSINRLSHLIHHLVGQIAFPPDSAECPPVTGMQGRIMGYLYGNRHRDIFQKDIQALLSVTRSTVTGNLQLMEKNGLITRQPVAWDARLKKIELTPLALEMQEGVVRGIRKSEERLSSVLTAEEKSEFLRLCEKIRHGLEDVDSRQKNRKEG